MTETLRTQASSDAASSSRRPARSALAMGLAAGMPIGLPKAQAHGAPRPSQELWGRLQPQP